jgi:hypothetical protein
MNGVKYTCNSHGTNSSQEDHIAENVETLLFWSRDRSVPALEGKSSVTSFRNNKFSAYDRIEGNWL